MRPVTAIFLGLFVFVGMTATVRADNPAAQRIHKLGQDVLAVMADPSISKDQRIAHFSGLLARDLDIPVIGRFVLGRHWRNASHSQRITYLRAFKRYVVRTYSDRLGGANFNQFKVTSVRTVGKRDILVRTQITRPNKGSVFADWRVRERKGAYKILDLFIEGVSMSMTLRQEFGAVLRHKGGIKGLIAMMNSRTTT
jgi:phospholipid transport system substrate-binding protein